MSVLCGRCHNLHDTVDDVKVCYGILPPAPPIPYSPQPHFVSSTPNQLRYVEILNGNSDYAETLSKDACSRYIDDLKRGGHRVSPTASIAQPDPKLDMLDNLLPSLPDGRYAIRADETEPFTFLRLKRHTRGRLNGCTTIQTQHSERLIMGAIRWGSSGRWSFEGQLSKSRMIELLLFVCMDPKGAGHNYAKELGRCRICGKELTDERSRWYGIGPDCETRHLNIIEWVDDRNGKSYEQAHRDLFV